MSFWNKWLVIAAEKMQLSTHYHVIPRPRRGRGNLPVQCLLLHSRSVDGTRRLPRRAVALLAMTQNFTNFVFGGYKPPPYRSDINNHLCYNHCKNPPGGSGGFALSFIFRFTGQVYAQALEGIFIHRRKHHRRMDIATTEFTQLLQGHFCHRIGSGTNG